MKIDMEHAPKAAEVESPLVGKKRKMKKNKSRFSDEQIKSLETTFEEETKLEPQRKLQLAIQLGLQPRQIAIWFQNKRARWKSKQLQREYNILRASYDTLASNFESLKKENHCLLKQLQKLSDLLEQNPKKRKRHGPGTRGKSNDADTDSIEAERDEHGAKLGVSVEERSDLGATACSDDENSKNVEQFMQNETSILNMAEPVDAPILIPNWSDFNSGCFSDQSCSSLNWWELWP